MNISLVTIKEWLEFTTEWFASLSTLEVLMLVGIACIIILVIYVKIAINYLNLSIIINNSHLRSTQDVDWLLRSILTELEEIKMSAMHIEDKVVEIDRKQDQHAKKNEDPYGLHWE